jgi:hypothetical protein
MSSVAGLLSQREVLATPIKTPDYASKQVFKDQCQRNGGTWSEGKYSTSCTGPNGTEVCDEEGKNCNFFSNSEPPPPPDSPLQDIGGPGGPSGTGDSGEVFVDETPTEPPASAEIPSEGSATTVAAAGDEGSSAAVVQPTEPATSGESATQESTAITDAAEPGEPTATAVEDTATLELVVQRCEAGYDPYDPRSRPDRECDEASGGTAFRLVGKGLDLSGTTGSNGDGGVQFLGLVPGSYHLNQAPVPGIALAFVGDCESDLRDFDDLPFFPLAIAGPDGDVGLRVRAGETLRCDWYQVPEAA